MARADEDSERPHRANVPLTAVVAIVSALTAGGGGWFAKSAVGDAVTRQEYDGLTSRVERVERKVERLAEVSVQTVTRLDGMDRKLDRIDGKLDTLVERRR